MRIEDIEVDEWDGKQHKAMLCVGCIVSGYWQTSPVVVTSCEQVLENVEDLRDTSRPRCSTCGSLKQNPSHCGYCGGLVNVKWKHGGA